MTLISKPIVFFGTEDFSLTSLQAIIDAGHPVAAVVTKPDTRSGRGHQLTPPPVKILAEQHDIPVWQPHRLSEIVDPIKQLGDPVGVLVSYGKIIPQHLIDLFTLGIINLHPSLLPIYRGPSPIETAILNGDTQTGVSIMRLSAAMDAGPVYRQIPFKLSGHETAEDLYEKLGTLGTSLLLDILPDIISGAIIPTPQKEIAATYCHLITKNDGVIDWHQPAHIIERQIRAYHQWPQSRTTLKHLDVIITGAQSTLTSSPRPAGTIETSGDSLLVHTGDDTALRVLTIKPIGKKEMPVRAFLAGYRSQLV